MAISFRPLPPEAFPESARPYVAQLNVTLRELCGLEGTLRNPLVTHRSDNTIARRNTEQVHVTRITPDISGVVSGASTVTGIPVISYASTGAAGTTTTVIPINATLPFPSALMAVSGGSDTVTLSQSATDTTLTWSAAGIKIFEAGVDQGFSMRATGQTSGTSILSVTSDFDNSTTALITSSWGSGALAGRSVSCWDARISTGASAISNSTLIGYEMTALNFSPSAGSTQNNMVYGARFLGPQTSTSWNNAFGMLEFATIYARGAHRVSGGWSGVVPLSAGIIAEPPTIGGSTQIGVLIRQRTAQAVANVRYGMFIDSQNSGVVRFSIYGVSDRGQFTGPFVVDGALGITGHATFGNSLTLAGTIGVSGSVAFSGTSSITQAATLTTGTGGFFGVSGTLGAGTSISNITPADQGRVIYLWAEKGTMGFSNSNTLRVIGNSINVPVNGAVQAFCTGTTWFVFSPSS